eukprot:6207746-Pleurochrysis_carterae.AAC.1
MRTAADVGIRAAIRGAVVCRAAPHIVIGLLLILALGNSCQNKRAGLAGSSIHHPIHPGTRKQLARSR